MKTNIFLLASMLTLASTQVAWAFPTRMQSNSAPFILENPITNEGRDFPSSESNSESQYQEILKKDKRDILVEFEVPTFGSYGSGYQYQQPMGYGYNNYGAFGNGYGGGFDNYGHSHGHHRHHHHHSHHSHHSQY